MTSRTLTIDIRTADAQTIAALKRIQKELNQTGDEADRTSKSGLSLGNAFAGVAVGAGIKAAADSASDLAEAQSKVNVVFGESAPLVDKFGSSSATALGQSEAQALEAVGTFGNLLRAIGLNEEKSAEYSITLTKLASDLASFNNTSVDDALNALRSGLSGETEPLKRFGVNLNEAALKAQALKMGLSDGKAVLDANAKAQAAYALILEQTTLAQGDFERTSDGVANKQRILAAEFENAKASLGEALMPAFEAGVDGLTAFLNVAQRTPDVLQQVALAGTAAAYVGPKIVAGLSAAAESLSALRAAATGGEGGLRSIITTAAQSPVAWGAAAVGVAGLAYALTNLTDEAEAADAAAEALAAKADQLGISVDEAFRQELAATLAGVAGGLDNLGDSSAVDLAIRGMKDLALSSDEMAGALLGTSEEWDAYLKKVEAAREADAKAAEQDGSSAASKDALKARYDALIEVLGRMREQGIDAQQAQAELERQQRDLGVATDTVSESVDGATYSLEGYSDASKKVKTTTEAVEAAVVDVAKAQDHLADAQGNVVDALKAVADANDAVADARRGVEDAEKGVAQALRGVEQARRGVTDAEEQAVDARKAVTEATDELAQAEADAQIDSDFMAAALQGVADAEDRLAVAQADSQAAQEALTQARQDYGATMQQLATDVAAATDDVTLAQIAIDDALKRQAEVNADPEATANDRKRAEIAVNQARRRLAELEQRLKDQQAEYDRNAAGVETSDAVVAAQDAVTDAASRQEEAQRNLEDAVQNVADTQVEANRRVQVAQDNLAQAIRRRADADQRVVDAKQAVVDANDRVRDATRGVEDANNRVRDAVDNVREAQKRVTDARGEVVDARGAVEQAERNVEQAVKDQYRAYGELTRLFAPGSTARVRMEWLTDQLRQQYDYLQNPTLRDQLIELFGGPFGAGRSVPVGGKSNPSAPSEGGRTEVTVKMDVRGVDDPAATADMVSRRLGWELRRLNGAA